jgi:hypothetical protein
VKYAALIFLSWLAACATAGLDGATELKVDSNVGEASVYIDDVLVGRVAEWSKGGRAIRAGFHRIEVRHPDYHSHFQEIEAAEGARLRIDATLRPRLE